MSADAKNRNAHASTDVHVLLGRLEKQKLALDAMGLKVAGAVADLSRHTAELADLRKRLTALEESCAARGKDVSQR